MNKDLQLTAEFITMLRSSFYGQILFEGALSTLGCNLVTEKYLETAHKAFDKIDNWIVDLGNQLPIFSVDWESAETFDAISAMDFMKALKADLEWFIPKIESALLVEDLTQDHNAAKVLVAALNRSAAVKNSYVETLSSIFAQFGQNEEAQQIAFEINDSQEYLRTTRIILNTFLSPQAYTEELCEKLRREASLTPADFRAHLHDCRILLNVYEKSFSYALAEIPTEIADDWSSREIPAVAAGYWIAYEFTPDDFMAWTNVGITGAPLAANWRRANFAPEEAIEWMQEGLTPSYAVPWRAAGFKPARAAQMLRRGVTDPAKAPQSEGE
jgi:hypothetical protein